MTVITQPLSDLELRVLGALIEKHYTTPDAYPMSLNAITVACNQTTNREPVMSLDEPTVSATLDRLRGRGLVRPIIRSDARVTKYEESLFEAMALTRRQLALLAVLMLRGPQTVGELRTRTNRLHDFTDAADVESALEGLATRAPAPLVVRLARQPGQKDARWAQLLGGTPSTEPATAANDERPDDDRVLALEVQVAALRRELEELRAELRAMRPPS